MGRVYAVASAKGGVGKTTTAATLGVVLASAGADVALVDADLGMATLADALGVSPTDATLHDVLAGDASPEEATYDGPAGVSVVPGAASLDALSRADPTGLRAVVETLAPAHEYVFLDTGAGLNHGSVFPLGLADEVLLVSTPTRTALRGTAKTKGVADRLDVPVAGLTLTRVGEETDAAETTDSLADLGVTVLASIPEDAAVERALESGTPVTTVAPRSEAADAYRTLATALTGLQVPTPESDAEDGTGADDAGDGTEGGPDDALEGAAADAVTDADDASDGASIPDAEPSTDSDAPPDAPDGDAASIPDAEGDGDDVDASETDPPETDVPATDLDTPENTDAADVTSSEDVEAAADAGDGPEDAEADAGDGPEDTEADATEASEKDDDEGAMADYVPRPGASHTDHSDQESGSPSDGGSADGVNDEDGGREDDTVDEDDGSAADTDGESKGFLGRLFR